MEELEAFAKHFNSTVNRADDPDPAKHFQRANGYILPMASTPSGSRLPWMKGLPNIYYYPDRTHHSSGQPTHACLNMVEPTGIKWVEYGGTEKDMDDWLGVKGSGDMLKLRFNGKSMGIWAVCVGAQNQEDIIIRRPACTEAVPASKFA
jgi:hypothetical protein